ncbi:uncharacterized protein LOC113236520 [Hyposmocoma kahamanoa]|uniref:uncharacterized protein LOC113236520 n=1 Tax=Hyposmocoma kahamanoa TaxID=1477025 RepID=UPI000E6D6077|nr:uncharacterized protein LOC113236520 [Hyposmocoma kahamanoa]
MSFKDKVVIVTGASSGIGAATAIKFIEEGAKVIIVGRNEKKLKNVSLQCEKAGRKPLVVIAELAIDDDVKRIMTDTLKVYGKLDILVNNAGMPVQSSILAPDTIKAFDKINAVNLRSIILLTNLAAPHIVETKGNIINISSVGSTSVSTPLGFAYNTVKAGLDHFTRCIALELAPKGVRVNVINPGIVRTDIMKHYVTDENLEKQMYELAGKNAPLQKIAESEEIADLILYLASDKAKSITGACHVIDNGFLLK